MFWMRRFSVRTAITAAAVSLALGGVASATEPIDTEDGLAVRGYDTVAFFKENAARKGRPKFTHRWQGATWLFQNAENRDAFVAAPEKYAPQYGGYCAWAVGHDYTAPGDPEVWTILDGRLFLNYNTKVQEKWNPERAKWIAEGDKNWPGILKKDD
jgi:hypothetical protein